MAGLKVIIPPASEPVGLDEILAQLKFDDPDPETEANLLGLIKAAREWCEGYQNRAYIAQTLELALDGWPRCDRIELPRPPLQSVTSVTYDGEVWDSGNYIVDDYSFVARLVRNRSVSWPSCSLPPANGILIRYMAGYEPVAGEVVTGEQLGAGDGEEQTYIVNYYPVIEGSVTVYFDDVPTSAYTMNYETGAVTCTSGMNVVVTIDYTQKTDYTANVPQKIKQAITLLTVHWYENGMCDPPPAVYSLLNLDRVMLV